MYAPPPAFLHLLQEDITEEVAVALHTTRLVSAAHSEREMDFPDSGRLPTATPKSPSPLLFPSEVFLKSIDSSGNENLQPAIRIKGNSPNL